MALEEGAVNFVEIVLSAKNEGAVLEPEFVVGTSFWFFKGSMLVYRARHPGELGIEQRSRATEDDVDDEI